VSLHPTLQPYAEAWTQSVEAISELVQPLVEGEWNGRTPCPGWSIRDVVSHVIGLDCEMLGDPRPIHALPRDLFHVTNDHQRYMEMQTHGTGPLGGRCTGRWWRRCQWEVAAVGGCLAS
jgi:uncharacterized protein (TIGR03083 family)